MEQELLIKPTVDKHHALSLSKFRVLSLLSVVIIVSMLSIAISWPTSNTLLEVQLSQLPPRHEASSILSVEKLAPHPRRGKLEDCELLWFEQPLDHFGQKNASAEMTPLATYSQRVFICRKEWMPATESVPPGPLFFYVGNEANVELYLNHTGLMWENQQAFGAALIFAEHRYFGRSIPNMTPLQMQFLSSEQALADYARLIRHLTSSVFATPHMPVLAFGGSYGGMLAAWFRMKYPYVVDGAIAASAPILSFRGEEPEVDATAFNRLVTFDASPGAGASPACAANIRHAWSLLRTLAETLKGRQTLTSRFKLCTNVTTVAPLIDWIQSAYSSMAMGNYPYPSAYIMNGASTLPAYPMREACAHLATRYNTSREHDQLALLSALSDSVGVFYNATTTDATSVPPQCFELAQPNADTQRSNDYWGYLYCTEMCQPFSTNGVTDMFEPLAQNWTATALGCQETWGVTPRLDWAQTVYGGRKALQYASNIVFSNGNYDPWSGFGVLTSLSSSVVAVMIEGGAHHLDLMFSHPLDPTSVIDARALEVTHLWRWVNQVRHTATTSRGEGTTRHAST